VTVTKPDLISVTSYGKNVFWFLMAIAAGILHAAQPDLGTEKQREAGKQIYIDKCAACHGDNGDGNGAKMGFRPPPRDFTSSSYKIRTTPSGEMPTTDDLKRAIKKGLPFTAMLAFPDLTEEELASVVYYIKTFDETFADPDYIVDPVKLPELPEFSEESAEKGKKIFKDNACNDCHGEHGRGDGPSAPTQEDAYGMFVQPADLTKAWAFRGGGSREDILRSVYTGLDGTGMAAYGGVIKDEDLGHLVNYVYSLGKDDPEWTSLAIATGIEGPIDLSRGDSLFLDAEPALFPIFGQIIDPGRNFYPGVNAVEVKAVYDTADIAIMLTWHDMKPDRNGVNGPDMEVPLFDPEAEKITDSISDAIAVQFPSQKPDGFIKPYFLFGDKKKSVDLWYLDLSKQEADLYVGKGSKSLMKSESDLSVTSHYENGQWKVIFKRSRKKEDGFSFEEDEFVPIALSVWDGFHKERGLSCGISSWFSLYMKPLKVESPFKPAVKIVLLVLLIELLLVFFMRSRFKKSA
jgi:DMSO reductase family type II enzyme heme b subunit